MKNLPSFRQCNFHKKYSNFLSLFLNSFLCQSVFLFIMFHIITAKLGVAVDVNLTIFVTKKINQNDTTNNTKCIYFILFIFDYSYVFVLMPCYVIITTTTTTLQYFHQLHHSCCLLYALFAEVWQSSQQTLHQAATEILN